MAPNNGGVNLPPDGPCRIRGRTSPCGDGPWVSCNEGGGSPKTTAQPVAENRAAVDAILTGDHLRLARAVRLSSPRSLAKVVGRNRIAKRQTRQTQAPAPGIPADAGWF